jgi:UDP-glucose:glycoprotein glucosyltransferase
MVSALDLVADSFQSLGAKKLATPNKPAFETAIRERKLRKGQEALPFDTVLHSEDSSAKIKNLQTYLRRLGMDGEVPILFANAVAIPQDDNWLQAMSYRVNMDLQQLQRAVQEGVFEEDTWLPNYFLFQASHSRNAIVIPEDPSTIKFANLRQVHADFRENFDRQPKVSADGESKKEDWAHMIVVGDFDTEDGLKLLADAMEYASSKPEVEILMLHNPRTSRSSEASARLKQLFEGTEKPDFVAVVALIKEFQSWHDELHKDVEKYDEQYWQGAQSLAEAIGFKPGQKGLVFNGRLVGPIPSSTTFNVDDFAQLSDYEKSKRLAPVMQAISELELEEKLVDRLTLAKIASIVAVSGISDVPEGIFEGPPGTRTDRFKFWSSRYSSFSVPSSTDPSIQIVTALDPTTEVSQRWIPILKVLSELDGVDLHVYLNPREKIQEIPIKRFYRHVLSSKPTFDSTGSLLRPQATFSGIPTSALLNLGMDVPPSWLVAPSDSIHDLDNIKLNSLPPEASTITAIYSLENILIEGHSRDTSNNSPPRGVQLLLGTDKSAHSADTIIMANLGYFQFKANPGFWRISLKPGRSSKIFSLESVGSMGYSAAPGDLTTEVSLLSFQGVTLFPRLSRNPGHEESDVLEQPPKAGTAASYLSRGLNIANTALSTLGLQKSPHADINIFSVASGHLYERMLAIMMASVRSHTTHTVKFWFIEQFLSPSFKSFLPTLAEHYNFSYQLITYKWPHWLRPQTEKQREIWGYKILFLDVLFPLSLEKVIFVDADQIVRTNMFDLVQHDLKGAPYGFTPMCDSRVEMEGFRFWKTGYWKSFLRGLPYHISALYVVDLKKFRELAAGDRLRQQYHQLSADPNSLSNLDQDLPNHMQMSIPIHSLPQEWLWCETWCDDGSLGNAKTIDLCNNPLTKEPKLERARRQVPEWTQYDDEIGKLREGWEEGRDAGADAGAGGGGSNGGAEGDMEEEGKKVRDEL